MGGRGKRTYHLVPLHLNESKKPGRKKRLEECGSEGSAELREKMRFRRFIRKRSEEKEKINEGLTKTGRQKAIEGRTTRLRSRHEKSLR